MIEDNYDEDKIACDICLYTDDFDLDELVICSLCQVGVHQTCYGSELVSDTFDIYKEEDWFCARCRDLIEDPKCSFVDEKFACAFCPDAQGAIKEVKYCGETFWCHVSCVNWLCNIWFNDSNKDKVTGDMDKYRSRQRQRCSSCRLEGGLFSCDQPGCSKKYHVRCAAKLGVIYSYDLMNEDYKTLSDPEGKNIYCNYHRRQMLKAAKNAQIAQLKAKPVKRKF